MPAVAVSNGDWSMGDWSVGDGDRSMGDDWSVGDSYWSCMYGYGYRDWVDGDTVVVLVGCGSVVGHSNGGHVAADKAGAGVSDR